MCIMLSKQKMSVDSGEVNGNHCTMTIWRPAWTGDGPMYLGIADAIARDVERGVLAPGTRLPTHRELARALGVTVGTVTRGYEESERRGLTVGEIGRGTFVRRRDEPEVFGWRGGGRGGRQIDLSLACPWVPPDGGDGRVLGEALQRLSQDGDLTELLVYDGETAPVRHREAGAEWIGRLGLAVPPERVVVTAGAQHALTVILSALLRPGDTLLTESLTYPALKAVAGMLGLRLRGLAMDGEGVIPESLDRAVQEGGAQALYCVPVIENPTCRTMTCGRREEIATLVRRHGLLLIEDAVHTPMAMDSEPIARHAPERTLHVTTLSKWATFGLRVGYVAAPAEYVERIRAGVRSTMWMVPPLMVELTTRWLRDGTAERLGARKRAELAARQGCVQEILGTRYRVESDARSLHFWLHLPAPWTSDAFVAESGRRGVQVVGAEAFTVRGQEAPAAVRVAIAAVPERADLRRGLEILREILDGGTDFVAPVL